ncbi:MAG TPA: hypothetical protein VNO52_02735 [Methylomirabilota bacterium]|nr:hypothetical protein [Methylomirabilota bacterium]
METLITILLMAGAAIFHAFMKKREEKEAETWLDDMRPGQPRGTPTSPAPAGSRGEAPRAESWEDQLRRLLEESRPAPPPVQPAPPPVPVEPPPLVVRAPSGAPSDLASDEGEGRPVHMPTLSESAHALERADHLDERVAERLHQVSARLGLHRTAAVTKADLDERLAWLRNPASVRTALVASIVLGPPKALES